ncbi:Phosphatidylinositol 3,5-bisphosphate-binding protein [Cystobasidiomycetes sp. EMM_F5]
MYTLSHQAPFSTDRTSSKGKGPQVPPYSTIHIFLAHASALRTLTLSSTGNLLVTSSNKGTLLRIFDTRSKHLVRELRRGSDQADIWSVAVADPDRGHKVAAVSDKGTVHVWSVGDLTSTAVPSTKVPNQHSRERKKSSGSSSGNTALSAITAAGKGIRQLKPYLPAYFSSHWSDMSWRIPPTRPAPPSTASLANAASGVIGIAQAFSGTSSSEQSSGSQTRQHLDERLAEEDEVATCVFVPPISSSPHDSASRREAFNKDKEEQEYELIVVTRAGAWYRLGLNGTAAEAQAPTANLRKDGRSSRNRSSSAILQPHISNTTRRSDSARPKDTTDTSSSDGQLVMLEYRKLPFPDRGDGDVWSSDEEEPEDS